MMSLIYFMASLGLCEEILERWTTHSTGQQVDTDLAADFALRSDGTPAVGSDGLKHSLAIAFPLVMGQSEAG